MKYLLVWQELPENVRFFFIHNPTAEQLEALYRANGHYMNSGALPIEQEEALEKVYHAVLAKEHAFKTPQEAIWVTEFSGAWLDNEIQEVDLPTHTPIEAVFTCGVMM